MTMATILRSSRYVRNFAEFATKFGFSHIKTDIRVSLIPHSRFLSSTLARSLTTEAAPKTVQSESGLGIALQKLDSDVKRRGKISRTKLERIVDTFQNSESVTSSQALMIIRCCGNLASDTLPEERSRFVNQVWESLKNAGTELDLSHYNALLRVYVENEYAFSPIEILTELERKGIEPNKLTYQRLINRYCQQGDIDGATKILEFMREKGIPINEIIFTALVRGHSEAGDMVSAADILSVMKAAGLEPTPDTYKELLCGYAKHGDKESIMQTLSECRDRNVHLLDTDFLHVILSLANNGHEKYVPDIISIMPKDAGYGMEAMNYILKLVHINKLDTAMQVLASVPSTSGGMFGSAMVQQLAKSDLPVAQMINICKELESKGINFRAFWIALQSYLAKGDVENSLTIMQLLNKSGVEMREHYFWPIFNALGRSNDNAGIDNLLKSMKEEYSITISRETIKYYVIPNKSGDLEAMVSELTEAGIPLVTSVHALLYHLLAKRELKVAADFATQYALYSPTYSLRKSLIEALVHTKDVTSCLKILLHISESNNEFAENGLAKQQSPTQNQFIESFLTEIANSANEAKSELLTQILEDLVAKRFSITSPCALFLKRALGDQLTRQLTRHINKLYNNNNFSSRREDGFGSVATQQKISRLHDLLKTSTSDKQSIDIMERLLQCYCKIKDITNIERITSEFEAKGFEFSQSIYELLVDVYLNSKILDKSEQYMKSLSELNPEGVSHHERFFKYCVLLVENDRLDDAVDFIRTHSKSLKDAARSPDLCRGLLITLTDLGLPREVKTILNVLVENGCISFSSANVGLVVKAHIIKGDLKEALKEFEGMCETYRCTPMKNELAKKFIEAEDAVALQRLTDLSSQIHGQTNSLHDLVLSFIECNCIRQAKKILQIPALNSKHWKLKFAANRYAEMGHTTNLERLVSVINDLPFYKTIPEFYNHLLRCYISQNNWEKGLKLYNQMVEEEVDPSDIFLSELGQLLKTNNQPVPFTVPIITSADTQDKPQIRKSNGKNLANQEIINEAEGEQTSEKPSFKTASKLIESFIEEDDLTSAIRITENLLEQNMFPLIRTLKILLKKLVSVGDTESLEKLSKKLLSSSSSKTLEINNTLFLVYIKGGQIEKFFDYLEESLERTERSGTVKNFSSLVILEFIELLLTNPAPLERYTKIAEKYAAKGNTLLMNVLWMYHFLNGEQKADQIWAEHIVNSPKVSIRSIIQYAQAKTDTELISRLMKTIETMPNVSNKDKGLAYSVLMEIYYSQGKYQESVNVLRDALKVVNHQQLKMPIIKLIQSHPAYNEQAVPSDTLPQAQAIRAGEVTI